MCVDSEREQTTERSVSIKTTLCLVWHHKERVTYRLCQSLLAGARGGEGGRGGHHIQTTQCIYIYVSISMCTSCMAIQETTSQSQHGIIVGVVSVGGGAPEIDEEALCSLWAEEAHRGPLRANGSLEHEIEGERIAQGVLCGGR